MDEEIHGVGIVVVAGPFDPALCDQLYQIMLDELANPVHIERLSNERALVDGRQVVRKVLNFQSRHQAAIGLIAQPFTIDYFRRFLGRNMALHSSVLHASGGAIVPPGAPGPQPPQRRLRPHPRRLPLDDLRLLPLRRRPLQRRH